MKDTELMRQWVDALRSGKYRQTRGWLRKDDGFCCLGVLCDISGVGEWEQRGDVGVWNYDTEDESLKGVLPDVLTNTIGISLGEQNKLASMNDRLGYSFGSIADKIEEMANEI